MNKDEVREAVNNVNPEKEYPVSYTIDHSGKKHEGAASVKGKDLTENQIVEASRKGFIGRKLSDHKNNKFNRECIEVETADERASDGAHHKYKIVVYHDYTTGMDAVPVEVCELNFQNLGSLTFSWGIISV